MRQVTTSSTDQSIVFYAYDTDGVAVDLNSGSAGLTLAYRIDQNGREGTPVSMTPVARLTANVHRDGAITSRGDGKHEVDLPDAAFATNKSIVTVEVDTTDADVFFAERIVVDDSLNTLLDRTDAGVTVTSIAPVAQDGSLTEIIIGDDYLSANGRAFEWTVDAVTGVDRTTALCYFGGQSNIGGTNYEWLVAGTITLDGTDWKLSFDLTKADTELLAEGRYRWSVEVQSALGVEITRVKNATNCLVRLVEKQT